MPELRSLILTHSNRATDHDKCSLAHFTRRYSDPERLNRLPPFESLPPAKKFNPYKGAVSLLRVSAGSNPAVTYVGAVKSDHKIQQATQLSGTELLVGYENFIELWEFRQPLLQLERFGPTEYSVKRTYEHPFFPGLHTIQPLSAERAVVAASAPDAVLVLNLTNGEVERVLRMPSDRYGRNYELTQGMDLREHYIHNDCQTTHVNAAYPLFDGRSVVVSTLIQGAVGVFDLETGDYRELTRGFLGCHGARVNDRNQIYFADSSTGALVFLEQDGSIKERFGVASRWLHDVIQVEGDVYAFSLADSNELQLWNIRENKRVYQKTFFSLPLYNLLPPFVSRIPYVIPFWVGNSTQFLSVWPVPDHAS